MKRLLQLIHVSDLHFASTRRSPSPRQRKLLYRLSQLPTVGRAVAALLQGTAGHDPGAFYFLEDALQKIRARDRFWSSASNRLVATGDLATWGDAASFSAARTRLRHVAQVLGLPEPIIIYGNHDVWPDKFPFWSTRAINDASRTQFRNREFPQIDWPRGPLLSVSAGQRGSISVYSLDTIQHERLKNALALGFVKNDRYWEPGANLPNQLAALAQHATKPEIRIVLTHHPVHDPAAHTLIKRLENAPEVANALHSDAPPGSGRPLGHLVLSGHTHEVFPAVNSLPSQLAFSAGGISFLNRGIGQLTIGTLCQHGWGRQPKEHVFQLFRFWELSSSPHPRIVVERMVYSRLARTGAFRPDSDQQGSAIAEEMELT